MIEIDMHTQPNDETCGPTSLHAIYRYYGKEIALQDVIQTVERSLSGGTLASMLGKHALSLGFKATIYISNVAIFDPTWFEHGEADASRLIDKLKQQMEHKPEAPMIQACNAYTQFLDMGGVVRFQTVSVPLFKHYFNLRVPILTGLSATYLYRCSREYFTEEGISVYDDVRGSPCGHFVVLCGYDENHRLVVADPHRSNPLSHDNYYKVSSHRLINAIMLGVLTFDANLLIIQPGEN